VWIRRWLEWPPARASASDSRSCQGCVHTVLWILGRSCQQKSSNAWKRGGGGLLSYQNIVLLTVGQYHFTLLSLTDTDQNHAQVMLDPQAAARKRLQKSARSATAKKRKMEEVSRKRSAGAVVKNKKSRKLAVE